MIKNELIGIIHELKDVTDKLGMDVSEDVIFSEASNILRGIYAGQIKPQPSKATDEKPTEKQIIFLKRQKMNIPTTKQEATMLIKKRIEENKG